MEATSGSTDGTVHVIDDDPAALLAVRALVEARGWQCRVFESAESFLETGPNPPPGCVVTDLRMPGLSGAELQERLLAGPDPLPVIVVSGHADVRTAVRCMQQGAVKLLEKPYAAEDLLAAIERAFAQASEQRQQRDAAREHRERLATLTAGERQVLAALLDGVAGKVIAARLGISMRTVDRRRQAVLEKMHLATIAELSDRMATYGERAE